MTRSRVIDAAILIIASAATAFAQTVIPTRYVADRFFAAPVTPQGDTLQMLMDTGGGQVFVTKRALERMGITPKFMTIADGDSVWDGGPFPSFKAGLGIPPALGTPKGRIFGTSSTEISEFTGGGMVGHNWFAGRVWVLDYPHHQAAYFETLPAPKPFGSHTIPMTLKKPLTRDFPRIQVIVAGDTVDMLLDTGATSLLSPEGVAIVGSGPAVRASAFAAARLWDAWHAKHPDWRVIPGGEANLKQDLIGVPNVTIAGYDVGMVWFAKRPNDNFDVMMKQLMDKPILASVGGTAFRQFKLTLDYVNQRVTFEKP